MTTPEYQVVSEKTSQQWDRFATINHGLLQAEVDMVVLYKEFTKLEGMLIRITNSIRELRQSEWELE